MDRRSFFGMMAGAAAVPALPAPSPSNMQTLALPLDAKPLEYALGQVRGMASVFHPGCHQKDYVYRTGYPAIDTLKSVSGVHKERMERRRAIS